MPCELDEMKTLAKAAASAGLDSRQGDLSANERFVMIRGAKVRNSMSQTFIADLQADRHLENFLNFLDN